MYHLKISKKTAGAPGFGHACNEFRIQKLFVSFAGFVFTFLVCNGAGSFACRLAGSLAFAAAAFCAGFFKICIVNSFDVFHYVILLKVDISTILI
jgi:hypothetical protein